MSTEMKKDGSGNEQASRFSRYRKGILWLFGAGLLAVVGYRGALGSDITVEDVALPAASAAEHRPSLGPPSPPGTATASEGGGALPAVNDLSGAAVSTAIPAFALAPHPSGASGAGPAPAPDAQGAASAAPAAAMTPDGKVVLNLATETELRKLPGIGKSRARAIVLQRERVGRFKRLEDLLRVKGIGPKRIAILRPKVVLDAP